MKKTILITETIFCLLALVSVGLAIFVNVPHAKRQQSIKETVIAMGVFIILTGIMGFVLAGFMIAEKIRKNKLQRRGNEI